MHGEVENILWVFCDELRADVLGCYGGHRESLTPNIDRLADRGWLFENCFTNSPVCVPARVSMHTGLLPEETGVLHNEADLPGYIYHGPPAFTKVLRDAGYRCIDVGKEHVPETMQPWSARFPKGGAIREVLSGLSVEEVGGVVLPGSRQIVAGRYPSDRTCSGAAVTAKVSRLLATLQEPFFLRASFLQPHTPVIAEGADLDAVEGCSWLANQDGMDHFERDSPRFEARFAAVSGGLQLSPQEVRNARLCYAAMVAWVDRQVGELVIALDASGRRHKTAIVLASDHGVSLGEGGMFGKHTFAQQSQRIPLIIAWPSRKDSNRLGDLVQGIDLPRTFCDLVGIAPPEWAKGRSLLSEAEPEYVLGSIGYGERNSRAFPTLGVGDYVDGQGWPRRACIRTKQYRLDCNVRIDGRESEPGERDVFLTDVLADPLELQNCADDDKFAGVRQELEARLIRQHSGVTEYGAEVYDIVTRSAEVLRKTRTQIMR